MMLNEDQLLMFVGMCEISQRCLEQGYKRNILDDNTPLAISLYLR